MVAKYEEGGLLIFKKRYIKSTLKRASSEKEMRCELIEV
jgi:hypothetical protein